MAQHDPRLARGVGERILSGIVGAILDDGGSTAATEGEKAGLVGRLASRSGLKHGLLIPVLTLVVMIVPAAVGALLGLSFINNLDGVALPSAPNDAPRGLDTILTGAGILALLFPFSRRGNMNKQRSRRQDRPQAAVRRGTMGRQPGYLSPREIKAGDGFTAGYHSLCLGAHGTEEPRPFRLRRVGAGDQGGTRWNINVATTGSRPSRSGLRDTRFTIAPART